MCSLTPGKLEQQSLDLTFVEGEEVTFLTSGSQVTVDLTGNHVIEMDDDFDEEEEDAMMGEDGKIFFSKNFFSKKRIRSHV